MKDILSKKSTKRLLAALALVTVFALGSERLRHADHPEANADLP